MKESKEEFIKRYEGYEAKGGQLIEHTLFPPITDEDGTVIVKVNMRFIKDLPLDVISGVNRFDVIEEGGSWMIKRLQSGRCLSGHEMVVWGTLLKNRVFFEN